MLENFLSFCKEYHLDEISDILGLLITIVGFLFTTIALLRSKRATTELSEELEKTRRDLRRNETVSDAASALALMEEIKRLHRQPEAINLLPERYSALRKALISIRSSNPILEAKELQAIQSAIAQFATFERNAESALLEKAPQIDIPKSNSIVSKKIDSIQEMLVKIRNDIGK